MTLHFNSHFTAGWNIRMSPFWISLELRMMEVVVLTEVKNDGGGGDNWSYKTCKAPIKSSTPIKKTNTYTFAGWMPFLLYN